MSGPFQRILRRNGERPEDRPEEPSAPPAEPAPTQQTTALDPVDQQQTGALEPVDQPTEATEPIAPDALHEQPTTAQPPVGGPPPVQPAPVEPAIEQSPELRRPGFRERGRLRRRLRYLRKLRELQVRDLGGLVFDLRRFERKRDDLVAQKIDQIRACDDELRTLETALEERRDLRDVREPGIGGTCPRCFALYGSNDRFCASCGAALGGAVQGPAQVPAPAPAPVPAPAPPPPQAPPAPGAQPQ